MSNRTSLEAYLDANGELVYSNLGTSMLPLLRQGRDLVIIEKKMPVNAFVATLSARREHIRHYEGLRAKRQNPPCLIAVI